MHIQMAAIESENIITNMTRMIVYKLEKNDDDSDGKEMVRYPEI